MDPTQNSEFLIVGQIGSTYGVQGWLKVLSFTEIAEQIMEYDPLYFEELKGWKKLPIEKIKEYGNHIIIKVSGINNPEEAKLLSGKKLAILPSQLPKLGKNEFYWNDLKGLTVINQHGETLGKVIYLIATGSNDVLVVKGAKEQAIPYLPGQVVMNVDLVKGVIQVNWDEI